MKLLANENYPIASVKLLRDKGYDITAISEISPGDKDTEVLLRAYRENRVIITFDRDYGEMIYKLRLPVPPGLIYLRFVPQNPLEPAEYVLGLLESKDITIKGKFTVGGEQQVRQRPLPINSE